MSEQTMIERMGAAIARENVAIELSDPDIPNDEWDRRLAKAALTCLLDPSEGMVRAAADVEVTTYDDDTCGGHTEEIGAEAAQVAFTAAIQFALGGV